MPAIVRTQATEAGLKWFEIECVSSDKVGSLIHMSPQLFAHFVFHSLVLISGLCLIFSFFGLKESDGKPKISYVTVFERPGLHEFLKRICEFADLVLFTAGLEGLLVYWLYKSTFAHFFDS